MSDLCHPVVVLERHEFCPMTHFCKRCGVSRHMVFDLDILCAASDNVIAISHIRSAQKFLERGLTVPGYMK